MKKNKPRLRRIFSIVKLETDFTRGTGEVLFIHILHFPKQDLINNIYPFTVLNIRRKRIFFHVRNKHIILVNYNIINI